MIICSVLCCYFKYGAQNSLRFASGCFIYPNNILVLLKNHFFGSELVIWVAKDKELFGTSLWLQTSTGTALVEKESLYFSVHKIFSSVNVKIVIRLPINFN